jgi:dTDP-4-dehydrorhamnose reductase
MTDARPILLLGPDGQVGWELLRTLGPIGPVVAAGRARADLADADALRALVREVAPGLIVNAAAYTAVDKAEEDAAVAEAVNARAPGVLAEEARRLDAPIVHYSTDYVFGGSPEAGAARPWREDDATHPLNTYGETKLAGERAVAESGAVHLIFRTAWVYGLRGRNFLLTMRRLAAERDTLTIVDDQRGAPTWCRAIAEATALAIACAWRAPERMRALSGVYHMTAAGETSWCGFAAAIFERLVARGELAGPPRLVPIATVDYPTPAARPAYSVLDGGKLREAFGLALPDWRAQLALCLPDPAGSEVG